MAPSMNSKMARFIGHLNPAAWDWLIPHQLDVDLTSRVAGPLPDPWTIARSGPNSWLSRVALNPQPLPPKDLYALALADAVLANVVSASRLGHTLGGEAQGRAQQVALAAIADFEEICPRWPHWPKHWPPPPPPPWQNDEMAPSELFFAGSRFLLAADSIDDTKVKDALNGAGNKLMNMAFEKVQ